MHADKQELLKAVPDFSDWERARHWIQSESASLALLEREAAMKAEFRSLEWKDVSQSSQPPFGFYSLEQWRKLALATFLADLASYPEPSDQVNFDRLLFVMHAFPQGFRTWWIQCPDQRWRPVGYTGWYPMFDNFYTWMKNHPELLRDRMVTPNTYGASSRPPLYLFNFSVIPAFKKSALSQALMKHFLADVKAQNARGLACITVSEEGVRVANRLGMLCSGYLQIAGSKEGVYIA